jgi:8-oxo-dGTP diphosphatase
MELQRPKVGIGVIVLKDRKILIGKRKGAHGQGTWCLPGGHLEYSENWEACAQRETWEEAGVEIKNIRFAGATNDIHENESKHYITLFMIAEHSAGTATNKEPDKCEGWEWVKWESIPEPRFKPLNTLIRQGYHPLRKKHDKLVRDKIIEIIEASGDSANWHKADKEEYKQRLQNKLCEEVLEYLESNTTEELADIKEVIHSLTALNGVPREQLELIQKEKRDERGSFQKKIVLDETV